MGIMRIRFYGGSGLNKNIKQKILNREYEPKQLIAIYESFDSPNNKSLNKTSFIFNVISFFCVFYGLAYQFSNGFKDDVEQVVLCYFIFYIICLAIFYYRLFILKRKQFITAIKKAYPELLDSFYSIEKNQSIFNSKKLNNNDKLAIDIAKLLTKLYKIIKQQPINITNKNNKYLFFRIKNKNAAHNCSVQNTRRFIVRIKERLNIVGYELTTGWIINKQGEDEIISKITIQINNDNSVKIDYQKEIDIPQFDETIKAIEEVIKNKYNQQVEINCITKDKYNQQVENNYIVKNKSEKIINLKNNDYILINLFNKEKRVKVFSTGDNKFDENGNYKEDNFMLNEKEIECLNWLIDNVNIEDYKKEIVTYCNNLYSEYCNTQIAEKNVSDEINIFAIAINVTDNWKSNDGDVYPEISFYGNCNCDIEHGICIGFRDKKFLGIHSQEWTL